MPVEQIGRIISGQMNKEVVGKATYEGSETTTAKVIVNNKTDIISADVKCVPNELTIKDNTGTTAVTETFDGSADKEITLHKFNIQKEEDEETGDYTYKLYADNTEVSGSESIFVPQKYTLPIATRNSIGGVQIGDRLTITAAGLLSADDQSYTLPPATTTTLGGIKVGDTLSIDNQGVLNVGSIAPDAYIKSATIDQSNPNKLTLVNQDDTSIVYEPEITPITVDQTYNATSTNAQSGTAVAGAIATKQDTLTGTKLAAVDSGITAGKVATYDGYAATIAGKQDEITTDNKLSAELVSGLKAVATSGAYSDLSGTPTKLSEFTNDSGFITNAVNDLTNYTKSSDLTDLLAGKENVDATILRQSNVVNDYITDSQIYPLSASRGKDLNDRLTNVESRGRFLST